MEYLVKKIEFEELEKAFLLIWKTFIEFIAPDYSNVGIKTFRDKFIENKDFKDRFKSGNQIMYGAYIKEKLVGVVSISSDNHMSCLFVHKEYHRRGIATILYKKMVLELKKKNVKRITVNASPYAVPFYHSVGFKDLGEPKNYNGIIYTPMEATIG